MNDGMLELTQTELRQEIEVYWEDRKTVFFNDIDCSEDTYELSKGEFFGGTYGTTNDPWFTMYETHSVLLDDELAEQCGETEIPMCDTECEMDYDFFIKTAEQAWKELKKEVKGMKVTLTED